MVKDGHVLFVATCLYLGSFFLPVCTIDPPLSSDSEATLAGWMVFVNLLFLLLSPFFLLAWLANPLLWRGLYHLCAGHRLRASILGFVGLAFGAVGVLLFPHSESKFLRYEFGCFVWLGSIAVFAFGSLFLVFVEDLKENGISSDAMVDNDKRQAA